jgi:hypothetical protein
MSMPEILEDEQGDGYFYVIGHDAPDDMVRLGLAAYLWDSGDDPSDPAPFNLAQNARIERGWYLPIGDESSESCDPTTPGAEAWTVITVSAVAAS